MHSIEGHWLQDLVTVSLANLDAEEWMMKPCE